MQQYPRTHRLIEAIISESMAGQSSETCAATEDVTVIGILIFYR